jgi:hypothetical protein
MPRSAAGMIWPHLSQTKVEPQAQRRDTSPLARSMYPSLAPQPEPPAPRPRLTREQAFDWSDARRLRGSLALCAKIESEASEGRLTHGNEVDIYWHDRGPANRTGEI